MGLVGEDVKKAVFPSWGEFVHPPKSGESGREGLESKLRAWESIRLQSAYLCLEQKSKAWGLGWGEGVGDSIFTIQNLLLKYLKKLISNEN